MHDRADRLWKVRSVDLWAILKGIVLFVIFLLPVLLILPGASGFPFPSSDAPYSDVAVTHYPNALYLQEFILKSQRVPLWSATILSGYPFAGNPLAGIWYPFGWVALLYSLPLGLNLCVAFHLVLGGAGMYLMLREQGVRKEAAWLGVVGFAAMPKLFAHIGAGHVTLIYAVVWTPWLLLAAHWSLKRQPRIGQGRAGVSVLLPFRYLLPGAILALIVLADIRWAVFALLLWWGMIISSRQDWLPQKKKENGWKATLTLLGIQTIFAGLLSAALILPLWEYSHLSSRAGLSSKDFFTFSLPFSRLLGFVFPDLGGLHEWMLYPGAVLLVLLPVAIWVKSVREKGKYWLWVMVVSLIFALGDQIPGITFISGFPGLNMLRVPARALFAVGLSIAALGAHAAQGMASALPDDSLRKVRLSVVALGFLSLALTGVFWTMRIDRVSGTIGGCLMVLVAVIWLSLRLSQRMVYSNWIWLGIGLLAVNLVWVNRSLFAMRRVEAVIGEQSEVAKFLASQSGLFRVYSPSYSLPQQTAARYGLQLADGVDPLQLQGYIDFFDRATGVPRPTYSVTSPPFATGKPETDNAAYLPDPRLLGLLNVRFVATEYDLQVEGLEWKNRIGQTRIYANRYAMPRAWLESLESGDQPQIKPVEIDNWSADRIELTTSSDSSALLVLSEINYPGWKVFIDNRPAELINAKEILRGVRVPSGSHRVLMVYRPFSVVLGVFVSASAILFWLISGLIAFVWQRKLPSKVG